MNDLTTETHARLRLLVAAQGDCRLVSQAVEKFGSATDAIDAPGLRTRLRVGLTDLALDTVAHEVRMAAEQTAYFLNPLEAEFPTRLQVANPTLLSVIGTLPDRPLVAVVGSRDADGYGLAIARTLGLALAASGVGVVSGGAHGVDAAVLSAALDAGGSATAFLGFGIAHHAATVPADLLARLRSQGTVISEFLPTAKGSKTSYLERNRLIAAMADAVVIVQARAKSGSLNTAKHANRYQRPVFCVPGDVGVDLSEGVNHLIGTGKGQILTHLGTLGRVVDRPELKRARWALRRRHASGDTSQSNQTPASLGWTDRVLTAIEGAGGALDRISLAAALESDVAQLDELMMDLELEGYVGRDPAGRYTSTR